VANHQPQPSGGTRPAPPSLDLPYYGIGFVDAVKRGFRKYATFTGRASRSEYWWWVLFTFTGYLVLGLLAFASARQRHETGVGLLASWRCR
jgi:Protein of unknown function (DUF805)